MNNFESKISDELQQNHLQQLIKESGEKAKACDDAADRKILFTKEMGVAVNQRFVYLALKSYHQAISEQLAKSGISMPDFDELTGKS